MATQDDVRRIALALPGVSQDGERFAFSVDHRGKAKGFAWVWMERVVPKKPRIPNPAVLAVRVANAADKAALLAADPDTFFTEPHYNGFPAVLVRLPQVTDAELRQILVEAWRCQAPGPLVAAYDANGPTKPPRRAPRTSRKPTRAAPATGGSRKPTRAAAAPAKRSGSPRPATARQAAASAAGRATASAKRRTRRPA